MEGSGIESIIDKYSGMISRAQALEIENSMQNSDSRKGIPDITNVATLLEIATTRVHQKDSQPLYAQEKSSPYIVNIQDIIYRIFNPTSTSMYNNRLQVSRTIVLGSEGSAIKFTLKGKLSEFIDSNVFERGDMVMIKNASFDRTSGELASMPNTMINKIMPAPQSAIVDYAKLRKGMKNIDIIGKVVELGPIRYVGRLGGEGQIAVSDCVITDMENSIGASLWGSSALATSKLNASDFIKIEFCSTQLKNDRIEIYANDSSRIVSSKIFEGRLRPALK